MAYGNGLAYLFAGILSVIALPALAEDCPDTELIEAGTLTGEGKSIGFIIGIRWGEGTLTLKDGKSYKFEAKGGKAAEIGASQITFTGTIYNLNNIDEFAGTYTGVTGGLTVYKGMGGAFFYNENCVAVNIIRTEATGLQGSIPAPGVIDVQLIK